LAGIEPGARRLDQEAAHYIRHVLRLQPGDRLQVFDPEQATEAEATVVSIHRDRVVCELSDVKTASCVPSTPAWLLLGLCKTESFAWALREATALGVTDIVPLMLSRSASSTHRPDAKRMVRWRKILVQGARQCGRGNIPILHDVCTLEQSLSRVPDSLVRLCLWEKATEPVGKWIRTARNGVALIIGPEGGIENEEARQAEASGFILGSLGGLILRTETAVLAALGAWHLSREESQGVDVKLVCPME